MSRLDDPGTFSVDASDMFGHIRNVGREFVAAWEASSAVGFREAPRDVAGLAIAGMGGSATAGDYFAAICAPSARVPVAVIRGSALPNWVSERAPVVVCSYSGNTAESLACFDDARARGAPVVAITRGGTLGERARAAGIAVHTITYEAAPRATTVHSLAPLLRLGEALGLCPGPEADVRAAAALHASFVENELAPEVSSARNPAKQLAGALAGRFPIVLGGGHLAAAAVRFRNQLAENGKSLGAAEALPEAGHNLIVGLGGVAGLRADLSVVTLEAQRLWDDSLRHVFAGATVQFEEAGVPVHRLMITGETILQQLLYATALGDYVSCYLAVLRGFDPTPIPQITRLRAALAGEE